MNRWVLGAVLLAGCAGPTSEPQVESTSEAWTESELRTLRSLRLDPKPVSDPSNRMSESPAAIALGRRLFYDPGLSGDGRFSCASCHQPERLFTDGLPLGVAAGTAARHTPGLVGIQRGPWFYWDGRADSLWAQAASPIETDVEMNGDRMHVARHVMKTYGAEYEALFGSRQDFSDGARFPDHAKPGLVGDAAKAWDGMSAADQKAVTEVFINAMKAIGAFEGTIIPAPARFDGYVDALAQGQEEAAKLLSAQELEGLQLFLRQGNCTACHSGPDFTDRAFHNLGLKEPNRFDYGRQIGASGVLNGEFNCRSEWSDTSACQELRFLDPSFDDFQAAFKTPSLRGVTQTAPYMHNGSMGSLRQVLAFYSELPTKPWIGHRELTLQPLELTEEQIESIIAFLGTLDVTLPEEVYAP